MLGKLLNQLLNNINKSSFFIASFSPLWAIMVIRYVIDNHETQYVSVPVIIVMMIIIASILQAVRQFRAARRSTNSESIAVEKSEEITKMYVPYIVSYLFPILVDIDSSSTLFVVVAAMTLVGLLYIKTRMVFANPALILVGFRVYEIKAKDRMRSIKIIAKRYPESTIKVRYIDYDLYIEQKH